MLAEPASVLPCTGAGTNFLGADSPSDKHPNTCSMGCEILVAWLAAQDGDMITPSHCRRRLADTAG